jgi:hypothetical protein
MKRSIRKLLAVVVIFLSYGAWIAIGSSFFGWEHGGGGIPTALFCGLAIFVWKSITKKTPAEKEGDHDKAINNDGRDINQ